MTRATVDTAPTCAARPKVHAAPSLKLNGYERVIRQSFSATSEKRIRILSIER